MFATWWQRLVKGNLNSRSAWRDSWAEARRKFAARPRLEALEDRQLLATFTWTGNGTDAVCGGLGTARFWSCGANWTGGVAPTGAATDELSFPPVSEDRRSSTNNLVNTSFLKIGITGGG